MSNMKNVLLLGASGSIGEQTLDIIRDNPSEFVLTSFAVGKRDNVIPKVLEEHKSVKDVYLIDNKRKNQLKKLYPNINFYSEKTGLAKFTKIVDFDMCVNALVGISGLEPSVATLKKDKILCLANKEALVVGGELVNKLLKEGKGTLYIKEYVCDSCGNTTKGTSSGLCDRCYEPLRAVYDVKNKQYHWPKYY